jgi:hypothetical protein
MAFRWIDNGILLTCVVEQQVARLFYRNTRNLLVKILATVQSKYTRFSRRFSPNNTRFSPQSIKSAVCRLLHISGRRRSFRYGWSPQIKSRVYDLMLRLCEPSVFRIVALPTGHEFNVANCACARPRYRKQWRVAPVISSGCSCDQLVMNKIVWSCLTVNSSCSLLTFKCNK